MKLTQYGDYFYLYILLLTFIPAIVLGLNGIKSKYYGIIASALMIYLIMGKSLGLALFSMFLVGEIFVIYLYLFVRKKQITNIYIGYSYLHQ